MSGKSTTGDASATSPFERIFRTYHAAGFLPILLPILLIAFALFVPNFVKVQNLFNVDYYDYAIASTFALGTYNAYPLPGRTVMARAGVKF